MTTSYDSELNLTATGVKRVRDAEVEVVIKVAKTAESETQTSPQPEEEWTIQQDRDQYEGEVRRIFEYAFESRKIGLVPAFPLSTWSSRAFCKSVDSWITRGCTDGELFVEEVFEKLGLPYYTENKVVGRRVRYQLDFTFANVDEPGLMEAYGVKVAICAQNLE
jgi:hypothetical protein